MNLISFFSTLFLFVVTFMIVSGGCVVAAVVTPPPLNIILSNDDGFETALIQDLFTALESAGHYVIMSAPYGAKSGTSAAIDVLRPLTTTSAASPKGTFPAGSPAVGPTGIAANQYYVDGAVTSAVMYGTDVLAPRYFSGPPDLVVMGPNEGQNAGLLLPHSGTVGGAVTSLNKGIPAIAVSADSTEPQTDLIGELMVRLLDLLPRSPDGGVLFPAGVGLNVNFPRLASGATADDYTFKPSRVGIAASIGLVFYEKLSDCPQAATFGVSQVHYPGLCLSIPYYSDGGYKEDTDPVSEGNVITNGNLQIAVSVIEGVYQSPAAAERLVFLKLGLPPLRAT